MEAGDVVVDDLDLLAGEAGVLVQDDLGLLVVLKEEEPGGVGCVRGSKVSGVTVLPIKPPPSYHFDRAEGNNGVAASAVGPGVPARVLALLKHILLPLTVGLLVPHPPAGGDSHLLPPQDISTTSGRLFEACLRCKTYGPHSTRMEPTFSRPDSCRLLQGAVSSWQRPWKFSCS